MIFWLDAQLPPSLAPWLTEAFHVEAYSMRHLDLHTAEDLQIFDRARRTGDVVLISKDSDFVELITQRGTPPRLLWVTCGNLTTKKHEHPFTPSHRHVHDVLIRGDQPVSDLHHLLK